MSTTYISVFLFFLTLGVLMSTTYISVFLFYFLFHTITVYK